MARSSTSRTADRTAYRSSTPPRTSASRTSRSARRPGASASSSKKIGVRARFSVGLDAGLFDDFSPGLVFARDVPAEFFGRAGLRLDALLVERRLYFGRTKRPEELAVQAIDEVFRQPRRAEVGVPVERLVAGVAGFGDRRHIGHQGRALRPGGGDRARLAGLDLRDRRHRGGEVHDTPTAE